MSWVRNGAVAALLGFVALAAPATAQMRVAHSSIAAVNPQPPADKLQPGLSVSYFFGLINHIREIPNAPGKAGPPLPNLDYDVGFGNVLTSEREDGVQAIIVGFIKLDKPGVWKFAVKHNDGVSFEIGGRKIYEMPGVQPDVMSDVLEVKTETPGWHALKMLYFEKRNTATLQLYWAPPGAADLNIAPPEAFAHLPQ